jgi:hypothetical protein
MILFGEASLRRALREYVEHYNAERPNQGIASAVLEPPRGPRSTALDQVACRDRLGGLLRHNGSSVA